MEVRLRPPAWATHLLSDLSDWERGPLPVGEVGPFCLPDDAYFEYAYLDVAGRKRPDPDYPGPSPNPWWPYARGLCGPAYRPEPAVVAAAGEHPRGRLLRLTVTSAILGLERRIIIYTPAGLAGADLPQVLCQDGKAYYGWGKLPQLLDLLVAERRIRPAHLIMVPPGERTSEYAFNPAYRRFLVEEVLPAVEATAPGNGERVLLGASLGGLLSATLAWQYPELFQTVVTQSGAFLSSPGGDIADPFRGQEWFRSVVRRGDVLPRRWYLDCGILEWLRASNRHLARALRERGYEVQYRERPAGHNWASWRDGLPAALGFALGGDT